MRLRAKLLTAATLFNSSQLSTTDVTKLTVGDLNYLNSHWRNGSMDGEFMRAKLVKSWPVTDLRRYPVARYMVLCKGDDDLDGDAEGMIGYIEVEARKDGYMTAAPDYKSYKGFPTYEEAVMEFATHGLE